MSAELNDIERKAMDLPVNLRALLAEHLLASLDDVDFSENERMWLDEANRRYQEYKSGKLPSRSYDDALANVRRQLS